MTKLVYIGGYGHSGSTLLEYLLSLDPAVLACGEVVSVLRKRAANENGKNCSCGRAPAECPVWAFLYESDRPRPANHAELLQDLVERAGGRYAVIIDSSKTAWGSLSAPFRLRRKFGDEFTMVHLMREPTAVCWSVLRQKDRSARRNGRRLRYIMVRSAWAVLGWGAANLACELFGAIHRRQYLRLRYEDLARAPAGTLQTILPKLIPKAQRSPEAAASDNRHQLQGNRIRSSEITLKDVREDLRWKIEMPTKYLHVVRPLSYLLRLRYGYVADTAQRTRGPV